VLRDFIVDNCILSFIFESNTKIDFTSNPDIPTIKNLTLRVVRVFIDAYCFVHSYNYDVVKDKVTCEDLGIDYTFPVIGEHNFSNNELDFKSILEAYLLINSTAIGDALSDFRRAIKYPETTAYYCHRSIETLRIAFFDNENTEEYSDRVKKDG
jgi:hypothetical protein